MSGYFGTNKKSGPNRENPLNSSLDITDYLLILIYIYREREREREKIDFVFNRVFYSCAPNWNLVSAIASCGLSVQV